MMRIKILISMSICCFALGVYSQQMPQYTQYLLNSYVYNPAMAGARPYFDARLNHREQWLGLQDAPRTNVLSAHGPLVRDKMGIGGYVYTDINGPTRQIGAKASYAYHLKLTDQIKLGLGVYGGFLQFSIDGSKISTDVTDDPVLTGGLNSKIIPDAGFGTFVYSDDWFAGISAPQLLNNKIKLYDTVETVGRLVSHFYAMGGYAYHINDDITLQPTALIKYVPPVNPQVDITLQMHYRDMVNFGVFYRTGDALGLLIGYNWQNNILIGYSYDYNIGGLSQYTTGSHELMLGIRFKKRTKN